MLKVIKGALIYFHEFGLLATIRRGRTVLSDKMLLYSVFPLYYGINANLLLLKLCTYNPKCTEAFHSILKAKHNKIPLVGLLHIGGIGDSLFLSAVASAVLKKYPNAKIFIFSRDISHAELFQGSDLISGVFEVNQNRYHLLNHCLKRIFDIILIDRYVIKTINKLADKTELADIKSKFMTFSKNWDIFPLQNYLYGETGYSRFEIASSTTNLEITENDLTIPLVSEDIKLCNLSPYKYITVHHGSDTKMTLPDKSPVDIQTKNWSIEQWKAVVEYLVNQGYTVVQVGLINEQPIENCLNLLGKLSLRETAFLLKYTALHLDTEGGLVHIARAVNTCAIVLFGPTPISLFGYQQNINIASGDCKNCFWSNVRWFNNCPKGHKTPICMDSISSQQVKNTIKKHLHGNKRHLPTVHLVDLTLFDQAFLCKRLDTLKEIYKSASIIYKGTANSSHNSQSGSYIHASKNWEYLYVQNAIKGLNKEANVVDVGAGRGALQIYLKDIGFNVFSVDRSFSEHSHDNKEYSHIFLKNYGEDIHFRLGSVFNLPFPDNYFDAVISVSVIEHLHNKKFAFYELLRVLKPEGILVLTFDITSQETLSTCADNTNRIEIFTPELIKECMSAIGVSTNYPEPDISKSLKDIKSAHIEGIPNGMTVGGMTLRKIDGNESIMSGQ